MKRKRRIRNLNVDQRGAVFDYVTKNRRNITLLQAGPGTGKTFTMLTIAHRLTTGNCTPKVVIYKNDLIDTYRLSSYGYTVGQVMMKRLKIDFSVYVALDKQLNSSMSAEHFINVMVNFVRRVDKVRKSFTDRLLILLYRNRCY